MKKIGQLTKDEVRSVECPSCGAGIGWFCDYIKCPPSEGGWVATVDKFTHHPKRAKLALAKIRIEENGHEG